MNNQTKTQENVKKALAKQTLGLPLTPHEHALVTLYGQSPVQQKENKPEFVVACQNCMLPVSKCKGDCTRKQILKNAANADKTEVKNGKHKAP